MTFDLGLHGNRQLGQQTRRAVLGDAHVDASHQNVNRFNAALTDLVERYCWGEIWTRDGLSKQTRSLINIAMLTALNRPHELGLHVAGARTNGCKDEEIAEVILQAAIYCGVPAAIDASRVAQTVLSDDGGKASDARLPGGDVT